VVLQETFLTKYMQGPHILMMQVSKITYLFMADLGVEYASYILIKLEVTKACGQGGNFLPVISKDCIETNPFYVIRLDII
jgi:hypothetical protein